MCMCVLSCIFLTGSFVPPRCFVPLLRLSSSHPQRSSQLAAREKEKPAKFANGSFLGNDSRIFVQHHRAYPLTRMRLSSSAFSHSLFLLVAFLPPISLFQSSTVPRRRHTSSLHFLLCPFSGLWYFPHDTLYFKFCLYFRFPFLHVSLRFLQ